MRRDLLRAVARDERGSPTRGSWQAPVWSGCARRPTARRFAASPPGNVSPVALSRICTLSLAVLTDQDGHARQVDGALAEYKVRDAGGALSCLGGTATGTGSRLFGRGQEIEFTLTERRPAPGLALVSLEGTDGGSATVLGTLSPSEDLLELNERCNGSGAGIVRGDARIVSAALSG